ncbi:MAG: hypothetical protein Q7R41_06580 [Phycisphaerales bacterium]|nr:hypothetical protein [Phycisphaerales bacterium]
MPAFSFAKSFKPAYPNGPSDVKTTFAVWLFSIDFVVRNNSPLSNGIVDFIDISASFDRFRNAIGAPPRTWFDVAGNNPTQGVNINVDFGDIAAPVDAYKGRDYPFTGPTAPNPCP